MLPVDSKSAILVVFALLLLTALPVLAQAPSVEQPCSQQVAADAIFLDLNHQSSETISSPEPLCFASQLPASGYWLIEAIADSPFTGKLRLEVQACAAQSTVFRTLHSALVAVPRAGTTSFCIVPSPDLDSVGSVRLTSNFFGNFGKGDPDEAETDPDPAPPGPPLPGKAASRASQERMRDRARSLCASHHLVSPGSELCAPLLAGGVTADDRLTGSEVHSYQVTIDSWLSVAVEFAGDLTGDSSQTVELLGPQGHRLARSNATGSPLIETLGPGTYTVRVFGTGAYSLTWTGSAVP